MEERKVDLNCDTGEGIGNEEQLMPYITACNIACGGHAGSLASVAQVVALAKKNQVKIGAHPSFPDKKNFGREFIPIPIPLLYEQLVHQVQLVADQCDREGVELNHIKPHGALYNRCAIDDNYAEMMIQLVEEHFSNCILYTTYHSAVIKKAKGRIKVHLEGFADRNYNEDHTLVSRKEPTAMITEPGTVLNHVEHMIKDRKIATVNSKEIDVEVDTICVHGDTPQAALLIRFLFEELSVKNYLKLKENDPK
ncbi:MAG: 5-oxoprolinase subunit PxpA [Leeuwenhoekiella sp.]